MVFGNYASGSQISWQNYLALHFGLLNYFLQYRAIYKLVVTKSHEIKQQFFCIKMSFSGLVIIKQFTV